MRIRYKLLNVLFLALFFSLGLNAQEAKTESSGETYRQGGWWTFGINVGSSYQSSDVCRTYDGWGVGLTLAKNVYYKPGATLALDLRGRLLYANQKGQDWERSTGLLNNIALNGNDNRDFVINNELNYLTNPSLTQDSFYYANHRTDLVELGLEGVINLNRLKERTNVIVNLYGGLNLDWYKARINQADGGLLADSEYDYSTISGDKTTALAALESLQDDTYETVADGFDNEFGTVTWMPSLGAELGYQITPSFSIVAGHKVTWSRDDILDGQRWNNNNEATGDNDKYHYTNLALRWIIDPKEETLEPPIIKVESPMPLPYPTNQPYVNVKGEIENMQSANGVDFTFNGQPYYDFVFNPKSENFSCGLNNLVPGKNTLVIHAVNMAGEDTEEVVIIYNEPVAPPTKNPPTVDITDPSRSGTTVETANYGLDAIVKNVSTRSDIKLYFNGSQKTNFSYSFNNGQLNVPLVLQEGKNTIRIVATNKDGSDEDQTVIIYQPEEEACPEPKVRITNITNPIGNAANPREGSSTVSATVENVYNRSDIKMYVNGGRMTDFSYNASTGALSANAYLDAGNNNIKIVVKTDCGRDEDSENVRFNAPSNPGTPVNPNPPVNPPSSPQPPIVDISTPNNGITVTTNSVNVLATVQHVTNKSQIRMTLNGYNYNNFTFNVNTKGVTANNVPIKNGNNVIEIKATNNAGTDSDDILVIKQNTTPPPPPPCPKPTANIDNLSVPAASPMNPNSAKSTLYGTVTNTSSKNQVKLYLNNKLVNFDYNTSTGKVTAYLDLVKGNNAIKLTVNTNCGSDQDTENLNFDAPSTPKPVVNIVKPANNATVESSGVSLNATVLNASSKSDIKVTLNGKNVNNFSFNSSANSVTANLALQEGKNTIKVTATNAGGSANDIHSVNYNKPEQKIPPVVKINKPGNGRTFNSPSLTLKATLLNVSSKSDATLKLNGKNITAFNFAGTTMTAQLTLKEGNNTIQVIGKNKDGQDQKSVTVKYVKPLPKPIVKITTNIPARGVSVPNFKIDANVINVEKKSKVNFVLNGKRITNFVFNPSTGKFNATVVLVQGKNTIKITGTNSAGSASDATSVMYNKPVTIKPSKPKVSIDNISVPAASPMTPNSGSVTMYATVTGVTAKRQITITINGEKVTDFTFNAKRGNVTATFNVEKGKTKIVVSAKNLGGTTKATEELTF